MIALKSLTYAELEAALLRSPPDRQAGVLVADDLDVVELVAAVLREAGEHLSLRRRAGAPLDRPRRRPAPEGDEDVVAAHRLE